MADRQLSDILSSGEVLEIKIAGSDAESVVLTKAQVDALFGYWRLDGNTITEPTGNILIDYGGGGQALNLGVECTEVLIKLTIAQIDSAPSTSAVTKEWVQAEIAKQHP